MPGVIFFQADLCNCPRPFDLEQSNSVGQHTWGSGIFLEGQQCPHPKGAAAASSVFGTQAQPTPIRFDIE